MDRKIEDKNRKKVSVYKEVSPKLAFTCGDVRYVKFYYSLPRRFPTGLLLLLNLKSVPHSQENHFLEFIHCSQQTAVDFPTGIRLSVH